MSYRNDDSETLTIELGQLEGRQLLVFLKGLTPHVSTELSADALEALQDKTRDANALAQWLRGNVVLDLQFGEAVDVLKTLLTKLVQDRDHTETGFETLTSVADELRARLPVDVLRELQPAAACPAGLDG